MTLINLPSYSPQLNPVERFFGEMRKFTANKIFREGIDALSKIVENAVVLLSNAKESIKRLTAYDWIIEQWKIVSEEMVVRECC
jgi:putative transposase